MSKIFYNILMGLVFVLFSILPAQAIPTVNLNLVDNNIYIGERFDVQVWVDGDDIGLDLLSFAFDVSTSDSTFIYDSYAVGTGFDDDSPWVPPEIAGSAFPAITDNNCLLATLSFTAIAAGTGSVETLGMTDNMFYGLAYEIDPFTTGWYDINDSLDVTINSSPVSPIPEPATMLLFGTGMAGFWGSRIIRKKKSTS